MKQTLYLILISFLFTQCYKKAENKKEPVYLKFNPGVFTVKSNGNFEKASGQILYLPLYSNIPYSERSGDYDLSGFLTIHNTDLTKVLHVTQILYFDNSGRLRKNFLNQDTLMLNPLQSQSFFIPEKDKSGTGANFLVEWRTIEPVNIPLIETVMLSLKGGQGVSFLSTGKVIEQMP